MDFLSPLQDLLVYGPEDTAGSPPQTFPSRSGSAASQAILNNDETSFKLENLDADTEYDIKVTAIYPDEAESEDLLGSTRTCKFSMRGSQSLYDLNALKTSQTESLNQCCRFFSSVEFHEG